MFEEKRKFKRFTGKQGAFAAFIKPDELLNTGQIQDISMGGLRLRYSCRRENHGGCSAIKIFGSNGHFIHLDRVQCRIVYDREMPDSLEQICTWCCGVEFKNLSVRHMCTLQEFIDHCAFDGNQCESS